jgi:hypothetical protein
LRSNPGSQSDLIDFFFETRTQKKMAVPYGNNGSHSEPEKLLVNPLGKKDDAGKPRWDLLPYEAVEQVVQVLTFGAKKYPDPDNWRRVPNHKDRYFAAAMRHLVAWKLGEKVDPETKLPHLAHGVCCMLFLLAKDDE